jgi:hypothetical protein
VHVYAKQLLSALGEILLHILEKRCTELLMTSYRGAANSKQKLHLQGIKLSTSQLKGGT